MIAATSADLPRPGGRRRVSEADLYYRLNVLLTLPPLLPATGRCQPVRIHPGPAGGKNRLAAAASIDAAALALLREQRWPGDLRQLRNTLEQSGGDDRRRHPGHTTLLPTTGRAASGRPVAAPERQMIQAALVGNKAGWWTPPANWTSRATPYKNWRSTGWADEG